MGDVGYLHASDANQLELRLLYAGGYRQISVDKKDGQLQSLALELKVLRDINEPVHKDRPHVLVHLLLLQQNLVELLRLQNLLAFVLKGHHRWKVLEGDFIVSGNLL